MDVGVGADGEAELRVLLANWSDRTVPPKAKVPEPTTCRTTSTTAELHNFINRYFPTTSFSSILKKNRASRAEAGLDTLNPKVQTKSVLAPEKGDRTDSQEQE